MAKDVKVDPRFLKYDQPEVEELLDKIAGIETAQEDSVRNIVANYMGSLDNGSLDNGSTPVVSNNNGEGDDADADLPAEDELTNE